MEGFAEGKSVEFIFVVPNLIAVAAVIDTSHSSFFGGTKTRVSFVNGAFPS